MVLFQEFNDKNQQLINISFSQDETKPKDPAVGQTPT